MKTLSHFLRICCNNDENMSLFLWISFITFLNLGHGDEGLYKSTDDVVILTNETFSSTVLGTENAWIVEFYNSWCGHCVNFAPKWKDFATDIKGWQKVISLGAIDCSQKHNVDTCRFYDIVGYPSLIFFPPYARADYKGENLHDQNIDSLRRKIIDFVGNFTGIRRPKSWPMLQALSSLEKIWDEAKDEHKHVILLFEDRDSYIGREVILDLSQYKHLLIRTITNGDIAKFGVTHLPSVFLLHSDGRFEHIAKRVDDRSTIVKVIKQLIEGNQSDEKVQSHIEVPRKDFTSKQTHGFSNGSVVFMQDLESALSYSFRQEIAIHKTIDGDALQALKDFIKVLTKYFPGEPYLMKFMWRVKTWVDSVTSGLTGEVWVYYIDSLQTVDTYLPEQINWVGCKGSEPRFRGYPCAMWTLFHTLTVNAYVIGKNSPKFLYTEVTNAITGYMKHFFGCQVCSKHFLKMADMRQISSATEQVLWLWRAHNQANQRLHGDESEDPYHPKIIFPSAAVCPKCRKGSSEKVDNPIWDETKVLEFLVKMYTKDNIVRNSLNNTTVVDSKKTRADLDWWERMQRDKDLQKIKEIRQMKKQRLEEKLLESGQHLPISDNNKVKLQVRSRVLPSISQSDMNMCVLFYGLCLSIIALLYYYFVKKKKMNPCNGFKKSKSLI